MFLPRNHLLQISPSLGGGGGFGGRAVVALELEIVKSPANSTASSPSSTLSECSNTSGGVLSIANRKPRTPRKRPNQTYNEAAALLSTAYPNLFNSPKYPSAAVNDMSIFFADVNDTSFIPEKPVTPRRMQVTALSSPTAGECNSHSQQPEEVNGDEFDFDAESILEEEVDERGIDSIMGNVTVEPTVADDSRSTCYGYPMGLGLGFGFGIRALRRDFQEANWWRFPTVEMVELSPRLVSPPPPPIVAEEKKSKKKSATKKMKKTKAVVDVIEVESATKECEGVLSLKLNFDVVLKAWSDKGSPFSEDGLGVENDDVAARLAEIELFPDGESGGAREACVLRYKEKRRTRLFSKKIRYQVRKVNADQRPRMKGRFVRRPNSKNEMNID